MLKVWATEPNFIEGFDTTRIATLPFELEPNRFQLVNSFQDADIIPVKFNNNINETLKTIDLLKNLGYKKTQTILIMELWHLDTDFTFHISGRLSEIENQHLNAFKENLTNNVFLVHSTYNYNYKDTVFYDILWNRQKAYCTDYDADFLSHRLWVDGSTKETYTLGNIEKDITNLKIFLCPNRIYYIDGLIDHPRMKFRQELKNFADTYSNLGFVSDPMKGNILETNDEYTTRQVHETTTGGGGRWYPVHNKYYQSSFYSVYVETLSISNYYYKEIKGRILDLQHPRSITEKTWDPLIKGHFILPFGYPGLIEDIKSYGFILPDFIDYSYDNEYNDFVRFEHFLKNFKTLLDMPIEQHMDFFVKYKHILEHNRQLFFTKPYCSLYNNLIPKLDKY